MAEAGRWKPYVQRQGQLLPTFVEDTLDPSDPVFFIDDAVESLDLTPFEQRYAETGEHAYAPRLVLKRWLYAATQGVFSGREIARRSADLAFRYLAGDGPVPIPGRSIASGCGIGRTSPGYCGRRSGSRAGPGW